MNGVRAGRPLLAGSSSWLLAVAGICGFGCATSSEGAVRQVESLVQARTGRPPGWAQADREQVAAALEHLLDEPLDADRAVRIALVNNPELRAAFASIGIAQGELTQAGLLSNPSLEGSVLFPEGGETGTSVEVGVAFELLGLLQMPERKRLATAEVEQATLRVGHVVLELAAEVRAGFFEFQAADQRVALQRGIVQASAAGAELARRQRAAGNLAELEFGEITGEDHRARLQLAAEELDLSVRREELNVLLGLWGKQTDWHAAGALPPLPDGHLRLDNVETEAVGQRLDLAAAQKEVEVLARQWALADGGLFSQGELGLGVERDLDGSTLVGPNVGLELPIFDQGGGEAEVAMARWLMGRKEFESRAILVRSEARVAREHVIRARHRAEYHRDAVLPLRRSMVEAAQKEYNFMLIGVYHLLRLKQEEYDAQREHIEALADYWKARAMLDLAIGGRLVPTPDAMPTKPAQPAPGETK